MLKSLNSPIKIKNLEIRNRAVMPPMVTRFASEKGGVTQQLINYHMERARGGVGPEDSCFALGVEPSDEGIELLHAVSQVITICRAVKIRPHGLLGSVAGFGDLSGFERTARRGRQLGTEGAGCIHPDQIPILHKVFSPTPESAQHARRILQAYEEGVGRGTASVNLDGKMVDIPVYHRAKIILESAEAIEAVERRKAEALARIS